MENTWSILIIIVGIAGLITALVTGRNKGPTASIKISSIVILLALLVFLHNIYWERFTNEMASKGWTLIYTLPSWFIVSLIHAIYILINLVKSKRIKNQDTD